MLIELDEYLGVEHTIRVPVSGGQAVRATCFPVALSEQELKKLS